MARKDFWNEPFDESTIDKLELFEDYIEAWLPVFVAPKAGFKEINIFDFFAGQGKDINGIPGSPIRTLEKIRKQIGLIFGNRITVNLYLNEFHQESYNLLVKSCDEYLNENQEVKRAVKVNLYNKDTEELFEELKPLIGKNPSLVFLDQFGVKFSSVYLPFFENSTTTDFLLFIPSSHVWRLGETKSFQEYLGYIDMEEAKKDPFNHIHRKIVNHLKSLMKPDSRLNLYPYSIKDGSKLHGIVFGATHPRAFDKFLTVTWSKNQTNGEANFDIDNDKSFFKRQYTMFEEKPPTKVQLFYKSLSEKILNKEIKNNFDAYHFSLSMMHPCSHAKDCINLMRKEGMVTIDDRSPKVNYQSIYAKPAIIVNIKVENEK